MDWEAERHLGGGVLQTVRLMTIYIYTTLKQAAHLAVGHCPQDTPCNHILWLSQDTQSHLL